MNIEDGMMIFGIVFFTYLLQRILCSILKSNQVKVIEVFSYLINLYNIRQAIKFGLIVGTTSITCFAIFTVINIQLTLYFQHFSSLILKTISMLVFIIAVSYTLAEWYFNWKFKYASILYFILSIVLFAHMVNDMYEIVRGLV